MIKTDRITVEAEFPTTYVCDVCKKEYPSQENGGHSYEWQEFVHLSFMVGFASVFGDGNQVDIDICQYCLYDLIGPYVRITKPENVSRASG